ncbi:MAG: hydroxyacylglutathione hydrolase [Brachymonas sp.]|nr:hydroxyacylglutathione hydrolase [Brachymonas sp.]
MQLLALPSLSDNYIWLLHDGRQALVCDPGEAQPAAAALQARGLELAAILITHHHADHTGGVADLYRQCANSATCVYLPAADGLAGETLAGIPARALRRCQEGRSVQALGLRFDVLDVPGHTAGHIAFYAPAQSGLEEPVLLCGDTLFSAGCGRLFEGTPAQMFSSLQKLAALPGNTRVCCAHEYTQANLRFAQAVEPGNAAIAQYALQCEALRAQHRPTLPSSLQREKAINPFLRAHEPAVQAAVAAHESSGGSPSSPLEVFTALRAWKDRF